MNVSRFGLAIFGSLLVISSAQAHPGHQIDDSGLLASIMHSLVTMDHAVILLAISAVFGLWTVTRRVARKHGVTRDSSRRWKP
jgi:hydrogenase/urease accessory protein HupE